MTEKNVCKEPIPFLAITRFFVLNGYSFVQYALNSDCVLTNLTSHRWMVVKLVSGLFTKSPRIQKIQKRVSMATLGLAFGYQESTGPEFNDIRREDQNLQAAAL